MSQSPEDKGVLSRWSQRKLDRTVDSESLIEARIEDELAQEVWQRDDVDDEIKTAALAALFRQSEFQVVDHMNEYDEDFTNFNPLGNVIPKEMQRMLKLVEERTRPDEQHADSNNDLEPQNKDELNV